MHMCARTYTLNTHTLPACAEALFKAAAAAAQVSAPSFLPSTPTHASSNANPPLATSRHDTLPCSLEPTQGTYCTEHESRSQSYRATCFIQTASVTYALFKQSQLRLLYLNRVSYFCVIQTALPPYPVPDGFKQLCCAAPYVI
jgi:hypothetical protein